MERADTSRLLAEEISAAATRTGVALSSEQVSRVLRFVCTLLLWRQRMALVSQRDAVSIVRKHVEDCFPLTRIIEPGWRAVDLGSGAGFPGLVLAIACPASRVTLIESQARKVSFLRTVIREAEVANAVAVRGRVEVLADFPEYRGRFDCVVSRAVWSAGEFLSQARPFLRDGGLAVVMKGPEPDVTSADHVAGFGPIQARFYELYGGERRSLILACRRFT